MGFFFTSVEEFNFKDPSEKTSENFPTMVAKLKLTELNLWGRRLNDGGSENGKNPVIDWRWILSSKVPTTFTAVITNGYGSTILAVKRGLSDMDWPTCGWWRTTGSFKDERWDFGPTPLRRRSWGLPMAPALRIISPFLRMDAVCNLPLESEYKTPLADKPTQVQEKKSMWYKVGGSHLWN